MESAGRWEDLEMIGQSPIKAFVTISCLMR